VARQPERAVKIGSICAYAEDVNRWLKKNARMPLTGLGHALPLRGLSLNSLG